jgi:hypothetical protein
VTVVHSLSRRNRLLRDLEGAGPCDLVLSEVKAAAADIVIPWADRNEIQMGLLHNVVDIDGGMRALAEVLEQRLALPREPQPSTR